MLKHNSTLSYPSEYHSVYEHCVTYPTFREWNNQVSAFGRRITDLDERNKFYGDMLEVFSEVFFTILVGNPAYGLNDYTPVDINDDFGVDATAINVVGHRCAVQVKYRSNPSDIITYSDIAKTFTSAVCQFDMMDVVNHDCTIFLFTNAFGVSHQFEEVLKGKAVIINQGVIKHEVDNNQFFWAKAYDLIFDKLDN